MLPRRSVAIATTPGTRGLPVTVPFRIASAAFFSSLAMVWLLMAWASEYSALSVDWAAWRIIYRRRGEVLASMPTPDLAGVEASLSGRRLGMIQDGVVQVRLEVVG